MGKGVMAKKAKALELFTIGYEKAKPDAVLAELKRAKVKLLVDTRAVAASRRPGFSKRQLAASLDEKGIAYLHLQKLGTPDRRPRGGARRRPQDAVAHLRQAPEDAEGAKAEMAELIALVEGGKRVCLLCYERDVGHCHRSKIAEIVTERTGARVTDLAPPLFE